MAPSVPAYANGGYIPNPNTFGVGDPVYRAGELLNVHDSVLYRHENEIGRLQKQVEDLTQVVAGLMDIIGLKKTPTLEEVVKNDK